MEILGAVFGSKTRVKIMRLFLLNASSVYLPKNVAVAVGVSSREVEKELKAFKKAGSLLDKIFYKEVTNKGRVKNTKFKGYILNREFHYLIQLENLLVQSTLIDSQELLKKFTKVGSISLVVISGVFVQDMDARIDLLIVGDKIKRGVFQRAIRYLESNIGRELKYSLLDTGDFNYRLSIGDHLLRDVFDFKHQILLDKIGVNKSE